MAQQKKDDSDKNGVLIQLELLDLQDGLPRVSSQSVSPAGTNLGVTISPRTINAQTRWLADNAIEETLEITENGINRTETIRLEDFTPKTLVLRENHGSREILRVIPLIGTSSQDANVRATFVGQSLPAVNVKTADNREVSLQSFVGKPLLLDFWATWCKSCRNSLPDLQKLYTENKNKGLVLLSIDQDQEPRKASEFWSAQKLPWPNDHLDVALNDKFPGHGIPFFVLVDSSGKVIYSRDGFDRNDLEQALNSALTVH